MQCNKLIEGLQPSRSIVFMGKAKQLQAKDKSVISLAGGEPDFDTPKAICEELNRQIAAGYTHYTVGPGLPELRQKIAEKLNSENGCNYSPDGIIVTPGGKFAIYVAVRSMINPGDEVMYLEPGWVSYPSIIEASGGVVVPVRLRWDADFAITRAALEEKYSPKVKMLMKMPVMATAISGHLRSSRTNTSYAARISSGKKIIARLSPSVART